MMKSNGRSKISRVAAAITAALIPVSSAVMPHGVNAEEQTAEASSSMVETIEVTATRRTGSLQEVPINISAVTNDLMEQQDLEELEDLARWVPGLTVNDQGGRSESPVIVRGLNTNSSGAGSNGGTVATYVGEIPLFMNLRLLDIDRVEVLIGPQGTLYGAGTLGGAIRYIPKKVDLDFVSGSVNADIYQTKESESMSGEAGFVVNTPIIDGKLGIRAAFNYSDDAGYIDYDYLVKESGISLPDPDFSNEDEVSENLYSVEDGNDFQQTAAKIQLRWMPTDWFDSTLSYFYQKDDIGARSTVHYQSLSDENPISELAGKYDAAYRFLEPMKRENQLLSLELEADLGFAELVSATGWSKTDRDSHSDVTDLLIRLSYGYEEFPAFSGITHSVSEDKNFTQEIRLVSANDGPLSWIIGGYYNNNDYNRTYFEYVEGFDEYAIETWGATGYLRPDSVEYASYGIDEITEQALFGEINYAFTDKLDVTLGFRQYKYEVTTESDTDLPLYNTVFLGRDPDSIIFEPNTAEGDDDGNLFKFNASYQFSKELMAYVTVSEGFRIGGVNTVGACPENVDEITSQLICALPDETMYDADTTTNYEVGVKTTWLKNKLTFNIAAFNIDWDKPQVAGITENGAVGITTNAKGANAKGVEISSRALVADNLTVYTAYSYAATEMTDDAYGIFGSTGDTVYEGDRLPGAPEHQLSLGVNYITEMWGRMVDLNYGLTAQSDVYSTLGLRNYGEVLPGYALSNISAKMSDDDWDVTFYVNNLFNKYAFTSTNRNWGDIEYGNRGDLQRSYAHYILTPRIVGIKFSYRFGM
jgi:outer membrane receptor protein involved in Fe transport